MFELLSVIATLASAVGAVCSVTSSVRRRSEVLDTYKGVAKYCSDFLGHAEDDDVAHFVKARKDLESFVTKATDAIHIASGKDVYGSLKLIAKKSNKLCAVTFVRDDESREYLELLNCKYDVDIKRYLHKDFELDNSLKEFECVDMRSGARILQFFKDPYLNIGCIESKCYKSSLVVPVRLENNVNIKKGKERKSKNNDNLIGFLTFDSKREYAFDKTSIEIAMKFSRVIEMYIYSIVMVSEFDEKKYVSKKKKITSG